MATFFTADQHFGHTNVIRYSGRPFADAEEMGRALVALHNAVVSPGDDVWHLGDFALDERLVPRFLPQLAGRHYLVAGNHDRCHPCHRKWESKRRKYRDYGFVEVLTEAELPAEGGPFRLCHLPYAGASGADSAGEPRYPEFRPVPDGRWLLCGHVHELWRVRPEEQMINVGVDQWGYAPVSLETLVQVRADRMVDV